MKRLCILLLLVYGFSIVKAQNCYQTFMKAGKEAFESLDFENAINQFEAAKVCDDKPGNNEIDQWIAKSQTGYIDAILKERTRAQSLALTAKSILELQKNDNATMAFRYAQYALKLEDNPDSRSAFYDSFYQLNGWKKKNFYIREILHFEGASNRFKSVDFIDAGQCIFVEPKERDTLSIYDFDGGVIGEIPFEGQKYTQHAYCEKTGLLIGAGEVNDEHFIYGYTLKNKKLSAKPIFQYKTPYNKISGQAFVAGVAISKNGEYIVASFLDGNVHVLDSRGKFLYDIPATKDEAATSLSFSNDGYLALEYGRLVKVYKLNPQGYDVVYKHEENGMYALEVEISPDHSFLSIVGDRRGRLVTIDGDSIANSKDLYFYGKSNFSKDGRYTALQNKVYDLKDMKIILELEENVKQVKIAPDNSYIVALGRGQNPILFGSNGDPYLKAGTLGGHSKNILHASFSPDSLHLLTTSLDGTIKIWKPDIRSMVSLYSEGNIHHMYSMNGKQALAITKGNSLYVFDEDGEIRNRFTMPVNHILSLSSDGKYLFGNNENGIEVWTMDLKEGKFDFDYGITGTSKAHLVSFSTDDRVAIYKSNNGMLSLDVWDFKNRKSRTLTGYRDELSEIRFSPDNKRVGALTRFGRLLIWNIENGLDDIKLEHSFEPHPGVGCQTFEFSKDGKYIATSSNDFLAAIWNLQAQKTATLRGHSFYINSLDFSPDGKFILSGSDDGTAKVWTLDGSLVADLHDLHQTGIKEARFSNDGNHIITKLTGQTVIMYPFDPNYIINYLNSFGIPDLPVKEKIKYGIPFKEK